jgi:hypothetical protein
MKYFEDNSYALSICKSDYFRKKKSVVWKLEKRFLALKMKIGKC